MNLDGMDTDVEAVLDASENARDYYCRIPSEASVAVAARETECAVESEELREEHQRYRAGGMTGLGKTAEAQMMEDGWESDVSEAIENEKSVWRNRSPEDLSGTDLSVIEESEIPPDSDEAGEIDTPRSKGSTQRIMTWRARSTGSWSGTCDSRGGVDTPTPEGEERLDTPSREAKKQKKEEEYDQTRTPYRVKSPGRNRKKEMKKEEYDEIPTGCGASDCTAPAEWDLSASELSAKREHGQVKLELWNETDNTLVGSNREALGSFARMHQRRVKDEWNSSPPIQPRYVCPGTSRSFSPMKVVVPMSSVLRNPYNKDAGEGRSDMKRPSILARKMGNENRDATVRDVVPEGFAPDRTQVGNLEGKVHIFPDSESSDEESEAASTRRTETVIGPWDSVSQVSRKTSHVSSTKKVSTQRNKKKNRCRRNRRAPPGMAQLAAENQKALVRRNLEKADQLWKRLEYPAHGEGTNPLEGAPDEVLRYDMQGKRFIELSLACGTIRAKNRVRDEWKAKCYAEGVGHRLVHENTGFDDAVARYKKEMENWRASYYRG